MSDSDLPKFGSKEEILECMTLVAAACLRHIPLVNHKDVLLSIIRLLMGRSVIKDLGITVEDIHAMYIRTEKV